ncbi:MAG: NUDIX hydrolase [Nostocaceae cyanobacterium]|nr:NUDIX hydrolase [Nostocaceae cyanobacterium]
MKKLKKWKILQSQMVINNHWCQVRQDKIELPDGKIIDDFFVNIRPEITVILPITSHQEIVLVRQYRHGVGEILLELPAGSFNPEIETPEIAAARELQEETGYITPEVKKIATLYDNPVKDTNEIHLCLAENVRKSGQQSLDVTEDIEVVLVPVEAVQEKIASGEICVSGSVAAILLGLSFLNR